LTTICLLVTTFFFIESTDFRLSPKPFNFYIKISVQISIFPIDHPPLLLRYPIKQVHNLINFIIQARSNNSIILRNGFCFRKALLRDLRGLMSCIFIRMSELGFVDCGILALLDFRGPGVRVKFFVCQAVVFKAARTKVY